MRMGVHEMKCVLVLFGFWRHSNNPHVMAVRDRCHGTVFFRFGSSRQISTSMIQGSVFYGVIFRTMGKTI